jgi:biopolymer transport protein ExbD
MITETKTASPPFWFFVVSGILWLIPAGLFWKSQMLVVEVLSPGSSISAGGIGSVGGYIAQLLMLSVIAAPIIFIILVVLSVLPFSVRSKPRLTPLIAAIAVEVLLITTAVAIPFLITEPKRKIEIVNLPQNVKYANSDYGIEKESSMVLTLTSDNKLYERQSRDFPDKTEKTISIITNEELPEKIKRSMDDKTPDRRIVYFKCDVNASFENVLQIFNIIRKADVDKVGLVVIGEKNADDPYQINPLMFEVKLPANPANKTNEVVKPNPSVLLVALLEKDGKLTLNREDTGTISDTKKLENKLSEIFKQRENYGVFRVGSNEVEKTVFLKVSKSSKYGDFIKLVEAVKGAGAQPIGIQIDDLNL